MRASDQGNDLGDEVEGREFDRRGPIAPGFSQSVKNLPALGEGEVFLGNRRPQDVATQFFGTMYTPSHLRPGIASTSL